MSDDWRHSDRRKPRRTRRGPARIAEHSVDLSAFSDPLMITELAQLAGRTDRLRVSLNTVVLGDVTLDFVADERIREGLTVTRAQAVELLAAVGRTVVLDKALDLLAVRARSSRDLRVRLRRAGAPDAEISWVIARLTAQGFLDDAAYARGVARAKALSGGVSKRKVISVLRQKGVDADVASEAIDATLAEVELDEYGAALAVAEKRLRAMRNLDRQVQRQRLYAFLARRGYESDVVRRVLAEVLR
jgi:regulatory protein